MTTHMAELLEVEARLADGRPVLIRPVLPSDKSALVDGLHRLSSSSRYYRFFSPVHELTDAQLRYFTELDYHDHFAFGAFTHDPAHPGLGVARYIRLRDDPECAEFAVAVVDDWHGCGLGGLLLRSVVVAAERNGIHRLQGDVLRDNQSMVALARSLGAHITTGDVGEVRATVDVDAVGSGLRGGFWDNIRRVVDEVRPAVT